MQTVSSGWAGAVAAPFRQLSTAVLVDFNKTTASGVVFFTINSSLINGRDFIKGGGDTVTFYDKYNYLDYTSKATDWSVTREIGQYPYGLVMAQADVQFDNTSKQFTPNFDATIGSGILPNRPLKIATGINAESLTQFVGFTGQPELTVGNRKMAVHAFDAMDYINNYAFTTSGTTYSGTLQNITTSGVIGYYLKQLGFAEGQFVMDKSLSGSIGFVSVVGRKFGDVLNDLMEMEQGLIFADENGIIRQWNRQHFYTASGTGYKFNLDYNNIVDLAYRNAPIINDVIVEAKPRAVQARQQVYSQSVPQLLAVGNTELFANFSDSFGDLPVTSVTQPVGGITTNSYYTANTSSDGSATDATSYITVQAQYLFGTTYKIVLRNTFTSPVYLTSLVLYGTPATVYGVVQQRYTDATSVANYGRNPSNNGEVIDINNDYIQDDATAQSLAYQLVQAFKEPRRQFIARVFANPALQIGDYGSLTIADTNEVKNVYLTGKRDILAPDADLQQELILEERSVASYFTINSSTIDGFDTIAP